MRTVNEKARSTKKIELMEKCYDCYAEHGLGTVGIKGLAEACGCSSASLYQYFDNLDDLIIQSTEYCMNKVEDEIMAKAPTDVRDLWQFIDGTPFWIAEKYGKKYRLMFQIYTCPKYREHSQKYFADVDRRYTEYAKILESKLGIPYQELTPLIFTLFGIYSHYALFEDEFYLKSQIEMLKNAFELLITKYSSEAIS